jgi:tetratricopeptide (TPR) repeat protein
MYLQRSRQTGEHGDVLRAEATARASLALRGERNASARVTLAATLIAQHRCAEARRIAQGLVAEEPLRRSYRALLGEVQMELGDCGGAAATFDTLQNWRTTLAVAPRAARPEELLGRTGEARMLLALATREAERRGDLPREQVAGFHVRRRDLELRAGRLGRAGRAYRERLAVNPEDHRVLAGPGRVGAARGRWKLALELDERAIARVPGPMILAEMSDMAAADGDTARAAVPAGEPYAPWCRRVTPGAGRRGRSARVAAGGRPGAEAGAPSCAPGLTPPPRPAAKRGARPRRGSPAHRRGSAGRWFRRAPPRSGG